MTRKEFHAAFRGKMLLALTEAFAARTCSREATAAIIDEHALHQKQLRDEIFDALVGREDLAKPEEPAYPVTACGRFTKNGHAA
jgi:hypothetical protein